MIRIEDSTVETVSLQLMSALMYFVFDLSDRIILTLLVSLERMHLTSELVSPVPDH